MQGPVEEEKIDSLNVAYHGTCSEELISMVQTNGSFLIDGLEIDLNFTGRN